jgi:predicted trehalose synthase
VLGGRCRVARSKSRASGRPRPTSSRTEDGPSSRARCSGFGETVETDGGARLEFRPTHLFESVAAERTEPVALMRAEQSNTSLRYGDVLMLKLFRRLQFGSNPDVEVGWFLTEHSHFRGTPAVVGSLEYACGDGRRASVALLQEFVANRGDAWSTTLARLSEVLNGADPAPSLAAIARLGETTATCTWRSGVAFRGRADRRSRRRRLARGHPR